MATRLYGWAWRQDVSANVRLVLLYLVERAGRSGDCWPSVRTISGATGICERAVKSHLAELAGVGLISRRRRHRKDGTRTSDLITLRLDATVASRQGAADAPCDDETRCSSGTDKVQIIPDLGAPDAPQDPSSEPISESSNGRAGRYPQHINEPNARRALETLIADRRLPATVDQLLEHAYRLGCGDPYLGYRDEIKPRTEWELATARDPAAALAARLNGHNRNPLGRSTA